MFFLNNKTPNILIFGDIMLDHHTYGSIEKLANEAPIPVLHKSEETFSLGGSGNVLNNLHSLGCNSITLFSIIGNDSSGKIVKDLLKSSNITHFLVEYDVTSVKNRFFCDNKILFRYDEEKYAELQKEDEDILFAQFLEILAERKIDSIIFSDYNKGFLTPSLCSRIIAKAKELCIFTCVDPKNSYEKYKGCSLIKPNRSEVKKLFNIDCTLENIESVLHTIKEKVQSDAVVITLADKGISYLNEANEFFFYTTDPIDVVDVTGAGDIVNCIISYYFPYVEDKNYIIKLSSYLATKSVSFSGTHILKYEDIIQGNRILNDSKLITFNEIKYINSSITFTNGCFDILHKGHLELFKFCKRNSQQNSVLIVGINSDDSIKRLKGSTRPINNVESRIAMLNSIKDIDYIIVFEEDTPENLLKILQPDVLVKGGDYVYDTIVGKEYCKDVKIFTTVQGYSTTNIINKVSSNL